MVKNRGAAQPIGMHSAPQADSEDFLQSLIGEFYSDRQAVVAAIRRGRSFNAIYLKSAFTLDFFSAGADGFSQSEMLRRRFVVSASPGLTNLELAIASPEDRSAR